MIRFFCGHKFKHLAVYSDATTVVADSDFYHVDYHLICQACGERLTMKHAKFIGGGSGFMDRVKKGAKDE